MVLQSNPALNPVFAFFLYTVTAIAEIAGCYSIHASLKLGKSPLWLLPGIVSLIAFGWLLSLHPGPAGRTYAAYGAVYMTSSIIWMIVIERHPTDRWDVLGTTVCLLGAGIIYLAPRA